MSKDYHVQDHSLLVPVLKRLVWTPVLSLVPERASANTLTLTGTFLSAIAFAITAFVSPTRLSCAVIAVLVFTYLTLDNIDGAHARRTGTSSPLGEFLDHWLDAINMAFLFVGSINTWQIPPERGVIVMVLAVLSYTLTFWEQRVTGRIHMGRMGNVEGIFTVSLFYLAGAVFGPTRVIETKLIFELTAIDLFWLSAILSTGFTTVGPIGRVASRYREVAEIVAPVVMAAIWYFGGRVEALHVLALLMVLAPALAGRMLIARVTDQRDLGPDRLVFAGVVLASAASAAFELPQETQGLMLMTIIGYAVARVTLDFVLTVRRLEDHLRPGELLAVALRPRG